MAALTSHGYRAVGAVGSAEVARLIERDGLCPSVVIAEARDGRDLPRFPARVRRYIVTVPLIVLREPVLMPQLLETLAVACQTQRSVA